MKSALKVGTPKRNHRILKKESGYAFVAPAVIVMAAILLVPLAYAFIMSFVSWSLTSPDREFVGLANYISVFSRSQTQTALFNQLLFTSVALIIESVLAMSLALLLNRKMKGLGLARTLLLLPPMLVPAVVGFNFKYMMNEQTGIFNILLRQIGLDGVPWLSSPDWVMASVLIVEIWQFTPLVLLLFIAGLTSLPEEPHEAARIDGANAWQTFWHVTLPMMIPIISVALVIRTIDLFRTFDTVWLMTGGGPGHASELLTVSAYNLAFRSADFGQASALSYIGLALTLIILGLGSLLIKKGERS